jgi:hypothetical protein
MSDWHLSLPPVPVKEPPDKLHTEPDAPVDEPGRDEPVRQ